jgi:hypothetical protein
MISFFLSQVLPIILEFCSAELLGSKYTVPCDPIAHLNRMYGKNYKWLKPIQHAYDQTSINWGRWKLWNLKDLPYVARVYHSSGKLDKKRSLEKTNIFYKYFKQKPLDELPNDYF